MHFFSVLNGLSVVARESSRLRHIDRSKGPSGPFFFLLDSQCNPLFNPFKRVFDLFLAFQTINVASAHNISYNDASQQINKST
jgi:hypothetical protein